MTVSSHTRKVLKAAALTYVASGSSYFTVWYCYLEEETVTDSVNTRELILGILMEVTKEGSYSHLVIRSVLDKYQYLEKKERAFITRVSEGTIQYMIELDYIINQFSKVKVNKMKPVIRNILRMSVKYMDSVPDSAVVKQSNWQREKGLAL